MDNGIYISLSRQLALFRDMETTANNIANMNTTGFSGNKLLFTSYMVNDAPRDKFNMAHDISTYRDTRPGSMRQTNNPLDVAINGDGYFVVQTPLGTRYTRAGNFQLNSEGELITQEGYRVLDLGNQPITFLETDKQITIGAAGNIGVDGEERAQLAVVNFANPQELKRRGECMYETDQTPIASTAMVVQGVIENSNVQAVTEMTHMIEVNRGVTSTAKFIEVMYDLQRKGNTTWSQQQS